MSSVGPNVILIGGPNGAGKSSIAAAVLPKLFRLAEFVNADVIATGLSANAPERASFEAGRVMLGRLRDLAAARADFAFETTMASRSFVPWLGSLRNSGYSIHMIFVWVRSASLARARVRQRVASGGHHVPPEVIDRRYYRGIANFLNL